MTKKRTPPEGSVPHRFLTPAYGNRVDGVSGMGQGDPIRCHVTLAHENGLHLTPITALVQQATQFNADVHISYDGKVANASSAVELMLLGATHGSQLEVEASGEEAEQAMAAVSSVLAHKTA